ncbi:MAG TPA: carboxylate--amine ligase, partial [Eubacteriaceae bacterium]|nr:carboxylate--amine ligase [Eubacteriaceae bacterium]
NGLAAILTIADRLSFDSPRHIGISRGHRIPSKYEKELLRKIETIVVGVVEALGVKEGPLYIQLLYGEKGLVVNEAALRIGGAFEEITIEESTGFSIMEAVIEGALGRDYSFDPVEIQKRRTSPDFFSVELFFVKEGLVSSLTPMENIRLLPGVLAGDYYIKKKERMKNIENATARAGYLVVKGDSIQQLEKRREFIYQKMQVLDEYENNLVIRGGRI